MRASWASSWLRGLWRASQNSSRTTERAGMGLAGVHGRAQSGSSDHTGAVPLMRECQTATFHRWSNQVAPWLALPDDALPNAHALHAPHKSCLSRGQNVPTGTCIALVDRYKHKRGPGRQECCLLSGFRAGPLLLCPGHIAGVVGKGPWHLEKRRRLISDENPSFIVTLSRAWRRLQPPHFDRLADFDQRRKTGPAGAARHFGRRGWQGV